MMENITLKDGKRDELTSTVLIEDTNCSIDPNQQATSKIQTNEKHFTFSQIELDDHQVNLGSPFQNEKKLMKRNAKSAVGRNINLNDASGR